MDGKMVQKMVTKVDPERVIAGVNRIAAVAAKVAGKVDARMGEMFEKLAILAHQPESALRDARLREFWTIKWIPGWEPKWTQKWKDKWQKKRSYRGDSGFPQWSTKWEKMWTQKWLNGWKSPFAELELPPSWMVTRPQVWWAGARAPAEVQRQRREAHLMAPHGVDVAAQT